MVTIISNRIWLVYQINQSSKKCYGRCHKNQNPEHLLKCYGRCHGNQDPEHLLIKCRHFADQQSVLIKKMKPLPTTLKTLFITDIGLKNLVEFLKSTNATTKRWALGEELKENLWRWDDLQN